MDYGVLRGTGQWRNSGKGRFTYELIETLEPNSFGEAVSVTVLYCEAMLREGTARFRVAMSWLCDV
jgi:hypothetical protein